MVPRSPRWYLVSLLVVFLGVAVIALPYVGVHPPFWVGVLAAVVVCGASIIHLRISRRLFS